jgi:hypothetical protein
VTHDEFRFPPEPASQPVTTPLPAPGTPLLTITWDTVAEQRYGDDGPYDESSTIPVTIGDMVVSQLVDRLQPHLCSEIRDTILGRLEEVISQQVEAIVASTLTGEIRTTDAYGSPTSAPTTLRALIAKQATTYMTDRDDRTYRTEGARTFRDLLRDEVNGAMNTELRATVVAARAQVAAAVKEHASELLGGIIGVTAPKR